MSALINVVMASGPFVIGFAVFMLVVIAYALFCAGVRAIRGFLDI